MSELFATLVAAAQGTMVQAEPRPRARFEQAQPGMLDIAWQEAPAAPGNTVLPGAVLVAGELASRSAAPVAEVARTAHVPLLQPLVAAPNGLAARSEPHADVVSTPAPQAAREPSPLGAPRHSKPSWLPAGAADAVADDLTAQPLLLPERADAEAVAPFSSTPDPQPDAAAPSLVLKIGRIEVRQPVQPAAATRAVATAVQSRPAALPRARVRQSLDDYRESRRR